MSTYADLLALAHNYADRTDLTERMPDFIRFAEKRIFRQLRCQANEQLVQIITSAPYLNVPNDILEVRSLDVDGEPLQVTSYEEILRWQQKTPRFTTPIMYGRLRERLYLYPTPDPEQTYTYTLSYYQDQSGLSEPEDTSPVLKTCFEAYQYGTLVEIAIYQKDFEEAVIHDAKFQESIDQANAHARQSDSLGKPMTVNGGYIDG